MAAGLRAAVLAPCWPELEAYRDRTAQGVPLHRSEFDDLRALAGEYGVLYDLE